MTLTEDFDIFFDADTGFAIEGTIGTTPFKGIMDKPYAEVRQIPGSKPQVLVPDNVLPGKVLAGDSVTIGSDRYRIVNVQPDGTGLTLLVLAERDVTEETVTLSGPSVLSETWMDEENPTSPMAEPPGGVGRNRWTAKIRNGQYDGHAVIQIHGLGPPTGPLPAGATIVDAQLWVYGASYSTTPGWRAYRVLKPAIPDDVTWLVYRFGYPWDQAGCLADGSDYDSSTMLGVGSGIAEGWTQLLGGPDFTQVVDSMQATAWCIVFHDYGSQGECEFYVTGSDYEPYLRITYRV
jgi:hypothetical protein